MTPTLLPKYYLCESFVGVSNTASRIGLEFRVQRDIYTDKWVDEHQHNKTIDTGSTEDDDDDDTAAG